MIVSYVEDETKKPLVSLTEESMSAAATAPSVNTVTRFGGRRSSVSSLSSNKRRTSNVIDDPSRMEFWTIPIADDLKSYDSSQKRLIGRRGRYNFEYKNVSRKCPRYCLDIFSTMIDLHWVTISVIFLFAFVLSWVGFASIWYLIAWLNNDYEPENLNNPDHKPCIRNGIDFASVVLFSLETQTTIGYGFRYATHHCPQGMILLMIQTCIGTIIQAFMAGFMFAKLARPKRRIRTIMLSKSAVICKRDGQLTLLIRLADMRPAHIICCAVHGLLVRTRVTSEGETVYLEQYKLEMGTEDGKNSEVFLAWPVIIGHTINEESPLYFLSKNDLEKANFEIIIFLEGASQSTGQTVQARRSYLPQEIFWGHQFEQMRFYQNTKFEYRIDFSTFNDVIPIENFPTKSAYQTITEDDQSIFTSTPNKGEGKDDERMDNDETSQKCKQKPHLNKTNHF